MSSIDGVNGLDSNLYELIQQAGKSSEAEDSTTVYSGLKALTTQGISSGNDGGIDDLRSQIDQAVSEALAGLDESSSLSDILAEIQNAVDSVMEANGVDKTQMQAPPPPPPPSEESDEDTSDTDETSSDNDPFMQRLEELLEENGFDAEALISQLQSEMSEQGQTSVMEFLRNLSSQQGLDATA